MFVIKSIILFVIFAISVIIGKMISERYVYRLKELEETKNLLNIFKAKVKFTYEPIPKIFENISQNTNSNIGTIFLSAKQKMQTDSASNSWEDAVDEYKGYLKEEDKPILKMLSKLLGKTDVEGQISQIEITEQFLDEKIKQAQIEKEKNEKLYKKLGVATGLMIVIILI